MNEEKPCRHEYVRIYQRKLKGLERRLVATRAFLPIGFKVGDFSHLGDNSYCFCVKCRTRLYPRRSQAEKTAARMTMALGKAAMAEHDVSPEMAEALTESNEAMDAIEAKESVIDIHVEELELESVEAQDIVAEGVKLSDDEEVSCLSDEDI